MKSDRAAVANIHATAVEEQRVGFKALARAQKHFMLPTVTYGADSNRRTGTQRAVCR